MKYTLTVRGCRGSFPHVGGKSVYGVHTSCLTLESEEELYILDAGSGLNSLLQEAMAGGKGKNAFRKKKQLHLLLSHLHHDHVSGLYDALGLAAAADEVHFYGPAGEKDSLRQQLDALIGPPFWPVRLSELGKGCFVFHDLQPGMQFQAGGLTVSTAAAPHPDGCLWYRLEKKNTGTEHLPKEERHGFLYGLDGELTQEPAPALLAFAKGAAAAVLDAQYTPEELPLRKGWGHSSYQECMKFAELADIGTALLTHYQPGYSDETIAGMEADAASASKRVVFVREGLKMLLEL